MPYHPCEVCGDTSFTQLFAKEDHHFHRCQACGLIRLDPQPTDATLASIYGGHYYKAWGVQTGADRVYDLKKKTFQKHVFNHVNLPFGARILDCGAAFGALMSAAAENGWNPYGIELAEDAAVHIRSRFGPEHVFSGPFEDASFPGLKAGDFDAVFMCDFIEHVRDPEAVLRKATEFLRPGGYLAITTPDGGSLSCRLMKANWLHYKTEHIHYFNTRNLPMLLQRIGLTTHVAQAAHKVLDFEYIRNQLNTYPRAMITPLINLFTGVIGTRLRTSPISFSFGEMVVVATKDASK